MKARERASVILRTTQHGLTASPAGNPRRLEPYGADPENLRLDTKLAVLASQSAQPQLKDGSVYH